jgi:hypothetical protein
MGISVEDLIRIRTVNTAPNQDIRSITPKEPRSYTDSEIEQLFGDDVDIYANYMSRADAIQKAREMRYQKELAEIRDRPGSVNIYETPDDPLELAREQEIVDARNAADQAAQDAADSAADANNAPQDAQAPATPAPNIA